MSTVFNVSMAILISKFVLPEVFFFFLINTNICFGETLDIEGVCYLARKIKNIVSYELFTLKYSHIQPIRLVIIFYPVPSFKSQIDETKVYF